jgi:hypothetical protein
VGAVGDHPLAQVDEAPPGLDGQADGELGVGLGVDRFGG